MPILKTILQIYFIIQIAAIILYIPRMRFWFEGWKKQKRFHATEKRHFALLIPARNESKTIMPLLESVKKQTYPEDSYDVYVIVKEEEDPTVAMVREYLPGAVVQVVPNQTRKAEALDACMQSILKHPEKNPDAYLVVDADCLLSPTYLSDMNDAMESGADVIIPRKRIKNWLSDDPKKRGLFCNCSAMTYVGLDAMGNKGKCKRNYTLALCGQGMLIKAKVIQNLGGYPFRSLTEDFEIAVSCMRNQYKQYYYEYAEIYSEEPVSRHEFNKRRIRWIKGFSQFGKTYGKEVRKITFGQGRVKIENFHFLYSLYPVYAMFATSLVAIFGFLGLGIYSAISNAGFARQAFILALLPLAVTYLQLFVYGIMQLTEDRDINRMTVKEKISFAFLYPFVTMEYIWIFIVAFTTSERFDVWEPVKRLDFEPNETQMNSEKSA